MTPCSFCNTLIPEGKTHCPGCGAPASVRGSSQPPKRDDQPGDLFSELSSPDQPGFSRTQDHETPSTPVTETIPEPLSKPPDVISRPGKAGRNGYAYASIILAILASCGGILPCCSLPLPIAAIILGVLGLRSQRKAIAVAGIAIGIIGLLISIGFSIWFMTSPEFAEIWQAP